MFKDQFLTVLCLQRGSNCNCPLRGSTYHPVEIGADLLPNIREFEVFHCKAGRRIGGHNEDRDYTGRPTVLSILDLGVSQGVNHPPMGEHELALGPIHICSRWAAWSSCRSSNNWSRVFPWACFLSASGCHAPKWITFSGFSVRICAQSLSDLKGRGLILGNWRSAIWGWQRLNRQRTCMKVY